MKPRASLTLLTLLCLAPTIPSVAEEVEKTPVMLRASDQLPAEILRGENYLIAEEVKNDGYLNRYSIESDYGRFEAIGNSQVVVRIQEVRAIAELKEISRTEAFADAAKRSATKDAEAAAAFAEHPVETAKGVPTGISRLVRKTSRRARDLKDDADDQYVAYKQSRAEKKARKAARVAAAESGTEAPGEKKGVVEGAREWWADDGKELATAGGEIAGEYAKDYLRYTGARRYWAKKLGVDPYGDNGPLNKQLNRVAQAAAAGGFTMKFVPIPSLSVLKYMGDLDELVWGLDELDLRIRNEELLLDRGYSEVGIERLYNNKAQTPSLITALVDALVRLDGVEGQVAFVEKAATTGSRDIARLLVRTARFYAAFHENETPIEELHGQGVVPIATTGDGRVIVALAVDHLSWTRPIANHFKNHAEILASFGADVEFWLEGGCTDKTRQELESRGYKIRTRAFGTWS